MQFFSTRPTFDHFKLSNLEVDKIEKFWRQVSTYESSTGSKLSLLTLMSDWVHEHLLQIDCSCNIFDKLSSKSFPELYDLVAMSVKPMDTIHFVQLLIKYSEFPRTTNCLYLIWLISRSGMV